MIYWKSWEEFFRMGGYGLYVWGSYAVTLAVMLGETVLARHRLAEARTRAGEESNP